MKIGIVSDTHDQVERVKKAIGIFNKEKVEIVYHLGDICSPFVLPLFSELKCKAKFIFGNNDADIFKLIKRSSDNISFHDRFYVDELKGKKICLIHGDPEELAETVFESKQYDIILKGHNHIAEIRRNERTLLINAGNFIGSFDKYSKSWTDPSIAVYDFE